MTTRMALVLALLIAVIIWLDLHFGWGGTIFAARKGLELIQIIAFWR